MVRKSHVSFGFSGSTVSCSAVGVTIADAAEALGEGDEDEKVRPAACCRPALRTGRAVGGWYCGVAMIFLTDDGFSFLFFAATAAATSLAEALALVPAASVSLSNS